MIHVHEHNIWLQVNPVSGDEQIHLRNLSSSMDVRYENASLNQLRALIEVSEFCRQVRWIKLYRCT